jgi:hypothetical protein
MHTNTAIEIWEDDFIRTAVYWPYEAASTTNYLPLVIAKRFQLFDYLKMLVKLLPLGHLWRFHIGEPDDYGGG